MISRSRISAAFLVVGAVLLIAPALAPVQPVLYHEVDGPLITEKSALEERGVDVIAYENLSDRGKDLYERALRNGGDYQVPAGQGASDFQYRTELEADDESEPRRRFGPRVIAIERPEDSDLPTLDERVPDRRPPDSEPDEAAGTGSSETVGESSNTTETPADGTGDRPPEQQEENEYTLLRTSLGQPPLTDSGNLLRFVAVLAGVVMLGSGGYLRSKP
ncbi:hypothetical protein ACOZ4N_08030 [Halorientalis pallida]|uniref:hypothetical protein n=1 Tax=Halorientalis pallida TaxID=2479928 RepID=UPI003C6FEF4B